MKDRPVMGFYVKKRFENESVYSSVKTCEKELYQNKSEESEIALRCTGQEGNLMEDNSRPCA